MEFLSLNINKKIDHNWDKWDSFHKGVPIRVINVFSTNEKENVGIKKLLTAVIRETPNRYYIQIEVFLGNYTNCIGAYFNRYHPQLLLSALSNANIEYDIDHYMPHNSWDYDLFKSIGQHMEQDSHISVVINNIA